MRTPILFAAAVFLLSSCLTDNMEKITTATKASVEESAEHIKYATRLQKLKSAFDIVVDDTKPEYLRVTSAETVVSLADEDRIGKYVAGFHRYLKVVAKVRKFRFQTEKGLATLEADIPNVTVIGDYQDPEWKRKGMTDDLFSIFSQALFPEEDGLIDQLIEGAKAPGTVGEDWEDLNFKARRVANVATMLGGGMQLSTVKEMLKEIQAGRSVKEARKYEIPFEERLRIAKRLLDMAVIYNFTEAEILNLKSLCDVRMGVRI